MKLAGCGTRHVVGSVARGVARRAGILLDALREAFSARAVRCRASLPTLPAPSHASSQLAAVARKFSPAKESEHEKVHRVQALSANERGMEIEEVLCSTIDNSCIAITVPVAWPSERAAATASEMAEAFAALARSAKPRSATDAYDNAPRRSVFEAQGVRLSGLRNMLNARFEPHLRMLVLTHARDVISPNDELEQALMTQMCYEGFTVQLVAIDLWSHDTHGRGHDAEVGLRKTYEVSLLFYPPCRCESEVEDRIIELTMATAG